MENAALKGINNTVKYLFENLKARLTSLGTMMRPKFFDLV
jgi:hypothetical protein